LVAEQLQLMRTAQTALLTSNVVFRTSVSQPTAAATLSRVLKVSTIERTYTCQTRTSSYVADEIFVLRAPVDIETKPRLSDPAWQCHPRATPKTGRVWCNLELAKKHADCVEYIVVHEMTHSLERNHGVRFTNLMDKFLPEWRARRVDPNGAFLADEER
jgi:hypothetical protein